MPIIFDESFTSTNPIRTGHQPDAGEAPNTGLEAVLSYEGLLLNDFRYVDRYRILEMSGLDDADIRDVREDRPDDHGEFTFNSFYGGRTITLRGKIVAGNWNRLRKMIYNLKTAFGTLEEKELSFLYKDWDYTYYDSSWTDDFLLSSSANLTPAGAYLTSSTTSARNGFVDFKSVMGPNIEVIQELVWGSAISGATRSAVKGLDVSNFLHTTIAPTAFSLIKLVANSNTTLVTTPFIPSINTTYWTRTRVIGNIFTGELWLSYPSDNSSPIISLSTTLAGADATLFGTGIYGYAGWSFAPGVADNSFKIGRTSIRGLSKNDVSINCKKVGKLEIAEQQTSHLPQRDFLLTLRSSSPAFTSRGFPTTAASMTVGTLVFDPGGSGLTFPSSGVGMSFLSNFDMFTLNNAGNFTSRPLIKLQGTCTNPIIFNRTSGEGIDLNGLTIASATNYILINCRDKTINDDAGNNLYSYLSNDSEWIQVLPGDNVFSGSVNTGTPTLTTYHRHSWL